MARPKIITSIDIGTEKVCTLIAVQEGQDRSPRIVGVASVPSKGLRKSQIVDLEDAIESITQSVDAAERMAGMGVRTAFVSIGGAHIASQNSKGVVAVARPEGEIVEEDVRRVIEAARAISLPTAREVIHVIPRDYKVDSQEGIKDPVGMSGVRLESEAHIITGSSTALRNTTKCINELGVQVGGFVFAGLASSYAVLTETERELGVVVLDIGAGSTSVCAFVEGSLAYSGVLPIGARHITSDIALGLRMSLQSAEKIKMALSQMPPESGPIAGETREQARDRKKREDEIRPEKLGITEDVGPLSRKTIVEGIIGPRLQEMFKLIGAELEREKLFPLIPAGIVLTGGGAETVGIVEVCKRLMGLPTRVGRPEGIKGLVDEILTPSYATPAGLLIYGIQVGGAQKQEDQGEGFGALLKKLPIKNLSGKLGKFLKSLMP